MAKARTSACTMGSQNLLLVFLSSRYPTTFIQHPEVMGWQGQERVSAFPPLSATHHFLEHPPLPLVQDKKAWVGDAQGAVGICIQYSISPGDVFHCLLLSHPPHP